MKAFRSNLGDRNPEFLFCLPLVTDKREACYYGNGMSLRCEKKSCMGEIVLACSHQGFYPSLNCLAIQKYILHRGGMSQVLSLAGEGARSFIAIGYVPHRINHEYCSVHMFDQLPIHISRSKLHKTISYDCIAHGNHPQYWYCAGNGIVPLETGEKINQYSYGCSKHGTHNDYSRLDSLPV